MGAATAASYHARKRDSSISIDNIRDRLAKFQTVARQDSTSTGFRQESASSVLGNLNTTSSYGGIGNLPTLSSQPSNSSILNETVERRTSTTISDLRARLNKIKQSAS